MKIKITARDHTYEKDTVAGVIPPAQKTHSFEIFNLVESQTVELSERARGVKAKINRQPTQPGDVPINFAKIEKAHQLLGGNPQVKIEDGIPRFIEWFRQQNP